jgi:hypothetical protein
MAESKELKHTASRSPLIASYSYFFPEGGVGLLPKRGCLFTLGYYAFPRWYEFGERRWNDIDRRKPNNSEKNAVPMPIFPAQIPQGLNWARTRASAVRDWRLTTWAMVRPLFAFAWIKYTSLFQSYFVNTDRRTDKSERITFTSDECRLKWQYWRNRLLGWSPALSGRNHQWFGVSKCHWSRSQWPHCLRQALASWLLG